MPIEQMPSGVFFSSHGVPSSSLQSISISSIQLSGVGSGEGGGVGGGLGGGVGDGVGPGEGGGVGGGVGGGLGGGVGGGEGGGVRLISVGCGVFFFLT